MKTYMCPVCGYDGLDENPYPYKDEGIWLSSEDICECCGFQFIMLLEEEDGSLFAEYREKWIKDGMKWFSRGRLPPADWNPKKQLENLKNYEKFNFGD